MLVPLIRTLILYIVIVASVRFMGKRQIGELQPAELCITILISAVASVPMQDIELPLLHGIVPIIALVAAEMLFSAASLKHPCLRRFVSGRAITVIRDGIIDQKALYSLRISLDDLLEDLRLKNVYDPEKVKLAQVETNGQLSVLLKSSEEPPSALDLRLDVADELPLEAVISDGIIDEAALARLKMSVKTLTAICKKHGANPSDVFLLLIDSSGRTYFAKKEQKK